MANDKPNRIVMIVGLFHPVVGGAELVCRKLAQRFIERGMSVTVLTSCRDGLPEHEIIDGIPVYRKMKGWHPFGFGYMFSTFCFLMKHHREFDSMACFGLFLFIPPAVLIKYLCGKKVIVRLMCSGSFGDFAALSPLKVKWLVTAAAKLCDKIVYMSEEIKKELEENGFPNEKLTFIPNGVDVDRFVPSEKTVGRSGANICFVGRIEKQKGLDHLLQAFSLIKTGVHDVQLSIVGKGQQRESLEKLARILKVRERVHFTGFTEEVLTFYQNALIFVLPSLSEGMSSSLLEAMACGLPVVVTAVGGNREVVEWGSEGEEIPGAQFKIADYGILVNPDDSKGLAEALSKLLEDSTLRNQLGERAREHIVIRFSQEQMVNNYATLFSQLNA